jgi:hypothetical protein
VNYIIEHSFDGSTFAKRCVVRVNVRRVRVCIDPDTSTCPVSSSTPSAHICPTPHAHAQSDAVLQCRRSAHELNGLQAGVRANGHGAL